MTWCFFFFQAEDGIRDGRVTGVQTCALPISPPPGAAPGLLRRGTNRGPGWRGRRPWLSPCRLERLEHGRDQVPAESLGDAVDRLVLAVEERGGILAYVVLVTIREHLALPERLLLSDLPVDDPRRNVDRVPAGLGRGGPRSGEADGGGVVGRDLALHDRVHPGRLLDHREPAALQQLLDHPRGDLLVQPRLAGAVLEERHPDALDRGVAGDPLSHEGVAAARRGQGEGEEDRGPPPPHRVTTLTSRPGTTTTFTTSLPLIISAP